MDEVLFVFLILVLPFFLISFLPLLLSRHFTARERGFRILITSQRRSSATYRFFTRAISSPALPLEGGPCHLYWALECQKFVR